MLQGYFGGGLGTLVDVSPNFWPLVKVFFSRKWVLFRNFRDKFEGGSGKLFLVDTRENGQRPNFSRCRENDPIYLNFSFILHFQYH